MDNSTLINRGTGAGGANTNKNGLPYEEMTDLRDKYTVIEKRLHYDIIQFNGTVKQHKSCKQSKVFKT